MDEINLVEVWCRDFIFDKIKALVEKTYPGIEFVKFPDSLNAEGISASYSVQAKVKN